MISLSYSTFIKREASIEVHLIVQGFILLCQNTETILFYAGNALYTYVHKECHKSSYVDTRSESPGVIKTLTAMIYNMGVPPFFPKQNTLLNI